MTNETSRMTKEEAFEILQRGGTLHCHAWHVSATYMSCHDGCCNDRIESVQEAMHVMEMYCSGKWERVYEV
jgi:hypothetical protein